MIEPNCDMPWDIYLDWLQDQGNEDLRQIDFNFLCADYHRYSCVLGGGDVTSTRFMENHSMGTDFCQHGNGYSMGEMSEGDGCNLGGAGEGYGK